MQKELNQAFEDLYEYLALRSIEAGDDLRIIEKALHQSRKKNEKTVLKGERRRVIEMMKENIVNKCINEVNKTFYEIEEDVSSIDFNLNQRNIKKRNDLKNKLKNL